MLELRDLNFHYPHEANREIISGVSLVVREGEMVALLGPNGCGKSTLLRLASGALIAQSGQVLHDGRPITDLTRREIARLIACVGQSGEVRFPLTALEYVLTGRFAHVSAFGFDSEQDVEIARQALIDTDADRFSSRRILELSMGERQRVALARALAQESRFLLLDEPTANADLGHQISLLHMIREMSRKRRLGAVIVTHDLNLASEFADRIVLLKAGRLLAEGTPAEVMTVELLSNLFDTPLLIDRHPQSGKPRVSWEIPI